MKKPFIRLLLGILPIIYMIIIWLQSSHFNPESLFSLSSHVRIEILLLVGVGFELFHFFQFGILYVFFALACIRFGKFTKRLEIVLITASMIYGLVDEVHQMYVPFRSFSISDLLKDWVGVIVASLIIHKSYFSKKKSRLGLALRRIEGKSGKHNSNIPF